MPRDTLTREQIVAAAVELLDAQGLDGLNMRALGLRLDAAATAVYWHVGGKADLIGLAADRAWGEIALPDVTATGWRAAAEQMATGLQAMLTRHPWLVQAFGSQVLYGPGRARYDDHSLAIYEAAGFTRAAADRAAATVLTFVLGSSLGTAAAAAWRRRMLAGGGDELAGRTMAGVKQIAAEFPRLQGRLATAAAEHGVAPEGTFEFGLRSVLDGLAAHRRLAAMPFSHANLREDLADLGSNFDGAPDLEFRAAGKALELEQSGLSYQRIPPDYRFPYGHTHKEQEEVYVVVGGSGRMKLDDEIVAVKKWDVVRVQPGTWRGYEAGPEGLEILVFGAPNLGDSPRDDVEGRRDWWAD